MNDLTSSQYLSEISKNEYEKNKLKLKEYITIFKTSLKNNSFDENVTYIEYK